MGRFISLLACAILLSPVVVRAADERTWVNKEGKQIKAAFVRTDGDRVVLEMNGKQYRVPLDSLSETDQEYIKTHAGNTDDSTRASRNDDSEERPSANRNDSPPLAKPLSTAEAKRRLTRRRTWTDIYGTSVQAEYVRIHGGRVVLMYGSRVVQLPLAELSAADQAWLRQHLEPLGQSHLVPAPQIAANPNPAPQAPAAAGAEKPLNVPAAASAIPNFNLPDFKLPKFTGPSFGQSNDAPKPAAPPEPKAPKPGAVAPEISARQSQITPFAPLPQKPAVPWVELKPPGAGFRIMLPTTFTTEQQTVQVPGGTLSLTGHKSISEGGRTIIGVMHAPLPAAVKEKGAWTEIIDGFKQRALAEGMHARIERDSPIVHKSAKAAREFEGRITVTPTPVMMVARCYITDSMAYMIVASRALEPIEPSNLKKLFDSFEITGAPAAAQTAATTPAAPATASPKAAATSKPDEEASEEWKRGWGLCSNCNKPVSPEYGAGDNCPHCGIFFDYEEDEQGNRKAAPIDKLLARRLMYLGIGILVSMAGAAFKHFAGKA